MASVQQHYQDLLAPIYGWMTGGFDNAVEAAREDLRAAGLVWGSGRIAVDLGAGPGAHAVAMAESGYRVTAIDTSTELLDQLRAHDDDRITCVNDDLTRWRKYVDSADAVLCMGDTLTHLSSQEMVLELLGTIAAGLKRGGVFMATFRDYTSGIVPGVVRFIPVRSEPDRILTCILDYGRTTVTVHDVLHELTDAGWTQRISSYNKLRLDPAWVRTTLESLGLIAMVEPGPKGMVRVIAGG